MARDNKRTLSNLMRTLPASLALISPSESNNVYVLLKQMARKPRLSNG